LTVTTTTFRQRATVVEAGEPDDVAAAVEPHHDGQSGVAGGNGVGRGGGRIDVQHETVLDADDFARLALDAGERARELRAGDRRREGLARALPGRQRLGRAPALRTHRRLGIRDATPHVTAVLALEADDRARGCGALRGGIDGGGGRRAPSACGDQKDGREQMGSAHGESIAGAATRVTATAG
jgi:hypothetical protein